MEVAGLAQKGDRVPTMKVGKGGRLCFAGGQMNSRDKSWEIFLARKRKSNDLVWSVARWLNERNPGWDILIPAEDMAEHWSDWEAHTDNGDLLIKRSEEQEFMRLEVKGKGDVHFTDQHDFPFPTVMVCNTASYDRADPPPWRYLIVNANRTHALIIDCASTRHLWTEGTVTDRKRGDVYPAYFVGKELCHFIPLPGLTPQTR